MYIICFIFIFIIVIFSWSGASKLIVENSFISYFKKSTEIYKDLKECGLSNTASEATDSVSSSSASGSYKAVSKLWIDKWSHQITKYEMNASSKSGYTTTDVDLTMSTKFNEQVTISEPKDFVTLEELKSNIQEVMMSMYSSSYSSY